MSGKPWDEIELSIIANMRKDAMRFRVMADELEKKADEHERRWRERHPEEDTRPKSVFEGELPEGFYNSPAYRIRDESLTKGES